MWMKADTRGEELTSASVHRAIRMRRDEERDANYNADYPRRAAQEQRERAVLVARDWLAKRFGAFLLPGDMEQRRLDLILADRTVLSREEVGALRNLLTDVHRRVMAGIKALNARAKMERAQPPTVESLWGADGRPALGRRQAYSPPRS
jgi:hypothetical protein